MLTKQKQPAGLPVRSEPQSEEFETAERPAIPLPMHPEATPDSGARPSDHQIGRYLVGKRLGSGGAASVYQAYDQIQNRAVALKMLLPGADADVRKRFRQEARTVASLRHPHIIQTLQVGEATSDGSAYIAMELVEGESLAQLLKRRGRISIAESCNLLAPIARALDYAHQQDIVHRDVKPSNILLRPTVPDLPGRGQENRLATSAVLEAEQILVGSAEPPLSQAVDSPTDAVDGPRRAAADLPVAPLLSDFGIARALDMPELTNEGRTIGTPAYMAPEQCVGSREVTGRADIYSLGAVLFRCLVGRAPFTGTTTQILHAHVYAPLSLPNDLLASLPPDLIEVLRRSLAKEPEERYANARELADDLATIASRILSQENDLAELTSTLTLVSLPSIGLPLSQLNTAETVIVPSRESQPESSVQSGAPEPSGAGERAASSVPGASPRGRTRLLATLLVSILALALIVVIGPAARNALLQTSSPAESEISISETERPLPSPTDEPRPVSTQAAAAPEATAASQPTAADPPAALSKQPLADCPYQAAAEFARIIGEDEAVAEQLGCPKNVHTNITYEVQHFQTGMALGRQDRPTVYIRYASNDEWEQREHDWRPGMQDSSAAPELQSPAEELFQPVRGIGRIWAESLFVRQALGWATSQPEPANGVLQSFEGGLLIYNSLTQDTYIFLKSQLRL